MRNYLLGVLSGILAVTLLVLSGWWLVPWWLHRPPVVAAGSTLLLPLRGDIPEAIPAVLNPFEPTPLTTVAIWDVLRKAAVDSRIQALVIQPHGVSASWAQLAEIRNGITAFRRSGKPVTAVLQTASARDYFLASAAGSIHAAPGDFVDLKGLRAELTYGRKTLDKLGIVAEFEAQGRYKDGADILTRDSSSAETREVVGSILDARYQLLIQTIATARGKTSDAVRTLLDNGPFLVADAKAQGLIDEVSFFDAPAVKVSAIDYQRVPAGKVGIAGGAKVAFLVAEGDILRAPIPLFAEEVLDPHSFQAAVRRVRDDATIHAVILRIQSPGGDSTASEEMLHEVKLLAARKPVIISMSGIAASAGYALATGGHKIVAYPETVTGSIGVFFGKLVLAGLYEKLGLRKELITRGRFADIDSDVTPLSREAREKLRQSIGQVYKDFVGSVAAARKKSFADVERVAQGRVWLGPEALRHGLVDRLGGIDEAIAMVKAELKLNAGDSVTLEIHPQRPGLWQAVEKRAKPYMYALPAEQSATVWKRLPWRLEIR